MKVSRIKSHLLTVPFDQSYVPTDWFGADFPQIIVEVETDQGLIGYGEAFSLGAPGAVKAALDDLLAHMLISRDPAAIAALQEEMFRRAHIWGRYGVVVSAIIGIDIALWDLAGWPACPCTGFWAVPQSTASQYTPTSSATKTRISFGRWSIWLRRPERRRSKFIKPISTASAWPGRRSGRTGGG